MRDYVSACIAEHLQNAEHDRISQSMWTDKKAFKSVMRYSMTLKNAPDHFVNTATEKQKPSENSTFSVGMAPAALKNTHHTPPRPPP